MQSVRLIVHRHLEAVRREFHIPDQQVAIPPEFAPLAHALALDLDVMPAQAFFVPVVVSGVVAAERVLFAIFGTVHLRPTSASPPRRE